jgi:Undecaprenyl-phosphate galactose phosphotransferase WbaP
VFPWNEVPDSFLALGASFVVSAGAVPRARIQAKRLLLRRNVWGIPAVIYGRGESVSHIAGILQRERGLGYTAVGIYDDGRARGSRCHDVAVLGDTSAIHESAPVAILSMPVLGRERSIELLEGPLTHYRKVVVIPDMPGAPSLWVQPRDLSGVLGLEIRCNLCSPFARFIKRAFDVTAVIVTLPLWLPVYGLIAVLISLDDHSSPFFYQNRVGKDGRIFKTRKFRTMLPNADKILQPALEADPALLNEWQQTFKLKNDVRITRVGRILRRYSLDELPQLLNVLAGEMSLVGPRPLPLYHHRSLQTRVQKIRERVRPGITGMWQVSGRSDSGNLGFEMFDPYYVRNWSLWLDAVVLFRTFGAVRRAAGAY